MRSLPIETVCVTWTTRAAACCGVMKASMLQRKTRTATQKAWPRDAQSRSVMQRGWRARLVRGVADAAAVDLVQQRACAARAHLLRHRHRSPLAPLLQAARHQQWRGMPASACRDGGPSLRPLSRSGLLLPRLCCWPNAPTDNPTDMGCHQRPSKLNLKHHAT